MAARNYNYDGKSWRPSATVPDKDSFFHSAFGVRAKEEGAYFDKHAKVRRMRWATFLTYFENELMPTSLANILDKCLSATEKYKDASVEDNEQFENYIGDIMEKDVAIEEIPVLATLENVTIVLFSKGDSYPVINADPNPEILGDYPKFLQKPKEVVLCVEGNTFSRMYLVDEDSMAKSTKNIGEKVKDKTIEGFLKQSDSILRRYKKGGSAGSKGVEFQVNLLVVLLFNSLRKLKDWRLSTENEAAGKFDDAVLEWPEGTVLVQAKYKENKTNKVNFNSLISTNTKNDDFSLPKYFLSYQEIKHNFKSPKNVVICTNASVHQDTLQFLDPIRIDSESMLYCGDDNYSFFKFKENILPSLRENVKMYLEKNSRNKNIDQTVITDENLKEFLDQVQFYSDYPLENNMEKVTEQLVSLANCKLISYLEVYAKVMDWFKQKSGIYLTEFVANEMLSQIKRDKHWQRLEEHKISFQGTGITFQDGMKMYHFAAVKGYLLQELKIYHTLKSNKSQVLYVGADDGIEEKKRAIDAFQLQSYKILIVIGSTTVEESVIRELSDKLRGILDKQQDKKIIFVTDPDDKFAQRMGIDRSDFVNIAGSVTYEELSADSREKLLNRNVVFQGRDASLRELLVKQNDEVLKTLNSETLENLIRREKIKVGSEVPPLEQHVSHYYISRRFKRLIEDEKGASETRKETIPEDKIFEVNEKLVLIAEGPGKGKTTVFSKLALVIKERYPHLWVFKIELNECCGILKKFKDANKKTINIIELLCDKDKTKLSNQLEEVIFLMKDRVVLLLDGVDEVSPDYTELVFSLIAQCQEEHNFAKVFINTRPHMSKKLEVEFHIRAFTLVPFTRGNQINFLADYWRHSLKLPDSEKRRCEQYAEMVLKATSRWVKLDQGDKSHFAGIPLQLGMLAEIFQKKNRSEESSDWEGCEEYLGGNDEMPKLPEKINIAKIYKMVIDKKRGIFIAKENPSGNTGAKKALSHQFQQCLCYHRTLALKTIVRPSECQLFSHYQKEDEDMEDSISKMGIVQISEDDPQFVHRTFAVYFVGESLLMELQLQKQNQDGEFQKFFFDKILLDDRFEVVRAYFDNFLEDVVDSLRSDIFKTYQSLVYGVDSEASSNLMHKLAKEGRVAILRLLFKCINYQHFITDGEVKITDVLRFKIPERKCHNTLSLLKFLLRNGGLNVIDRSGKTALCYAAEGGHLEMVKFLVAQGAHVKSTDFYGSPLNAAVRHNHFDVVKFLVEQGADLKIKGYDILYYSINTNHTNMSAYLLDRILEVQGLDVKDPIVPYTAAYLGRMDLLREFKEKGLNVNSTIESGQPLIFGAALGGQADTIKYLIKQCVNVNSRDERGNTALHLAAKRSTHLSVAKTLVELGIDVNFGNIYGHTALHCNVEILDMVEFLVGNGADVNIKNAEGRTALWIAASRKQLESVKFLVRHGSDINVPDNDGNTVLHFARGDTIKYLVECGVNVHIRNGKGYSPLHTAVENKELDTIRSLVQCGVDVNAKDDRGNTALHLAAKSTRYQWHMIECLVELGGEINFCNKEGHTPLHIASIWGKLDVVKCLVQFGVDVDLRDKESCTALHLAAWNGRWEVVKFLMERDAGVDIDENSRKMISYLTSGNARICCTLHQAAGFGNFDMVNLCVQLGVHINITSECGRTPLHYAAKGHFGTTKFLVEHGADINIKDVEGCTPLHYAVLSCRRDVVEYFLELGMNFDITDDGGYTILYYAIRSRQWDMVDFFLDRRMDINARDRRGRTPLHYAVHAGEWNISKIFLKRGMDVNAKDDDGCTAIHSAASKCNLEFVKRLLQRGADASITDKRGRTVLHFAVRDRQLHVAKHFLRLGVDHNIKDAEGRTALHLAVLEGQLEVVKVHVGSGTNVNIKDGDGRTPIHLAAEKGDLDAVQFLLQFDADVNVRDNRGRTPLHFAVLSKNVDIIKKFVELGGDVNIADNDGYRPLHLVASFPSSTWPNLSWHVTEFLVQQGADIRSKASDGSTAAMSAEKSGNYHLLQFLEPRTTRKTFSLVSLS